MLLELLAISILVPHLSSCRNRLLLLDIGRASTALICSANVMHKRLRRRGWDTCFLEHSIGWWYSQPSLPSAFFPTGWSTVAKVSSIVLFPSSPSYMAASYCPGKTDFYVTLVTDNATPKPAGLRATSKPRPIRVCLPPCVLRAPAPVSVPSEP